MKKKTEQLIETVFIAVVLASFILVLVPSALTNIFGVDTRVAVASGLILSGVLIGGVITKLKLLFPIILLVVFFAMIISWDLAGVVGERISRGFVSNYLLNITIVSITASVVLGVIRWQQKGSGKMKKKTKQSIEWIVYGALLAAIISVVVQIILGHLIAGGTTYQATQLPVVVGLIFSGIFIGVIGGKLPLMIVTALLAVFVRITIVVAAVYIIGGSIEFALVQGLWQTYVVDVVIVVIPITFIFSVNRLLRGGK